MMQILDGKLLAEDMITEIKTKIQNLKINGMQPKLQIIQVGDNSESSTYVRMKRKKAEEIGAICNVDNLPVQATADELMILIDKYNKDQTVHGILVQMPLPDHLPKQKIINLINPAKDVDGLTAANQAKLLQNDPTGLVPATPRGIMIMLERYKIELNGKKVVVVGRSHLVGLPTALLCLHKNATVTICHSQTSNLMAETADADV
ncbi:MAG TPA: bifunctional 5,10-methylenetetrahydrofolate dehydrogenase/5,10-methenyltetrahydrofolate cyclohydrolase, partial [bacterium]|nr:bifunctional 5,10-methylenetetrahydrofolate dehydrogenase/5,10-methenyltetrahydrofolate cyclohydrolase [bacterium]